jgi:hypothetical protein
MLEKDNTMALVGKLLLTYLVARREEDLGGTGCLCADMAAQVVAEHPHSLDV